ncbi:MAG: hypothetical protein JXR70_10165 [Spirochaetales bacterium]|nr:hypothetical protein [Spirochaetales bacterium]
MKKTMILYCAIFLLFSLPLFSEESENKNINIGQTMRNMMNTFININQSFKANDYFETSEGLMDLAKLVKPLTKINPPKGSKEQWNTFLNELIKNCFLAIGAAADENSEAIKKYLGRISEIQKQGHTLFR